MTETMLTVEDVSLPTYGIACIEGGVTKARADDVSTDKALIEKSVRLFNENELLYDHFEAAIEDIVEESACIDDRYTRPQILKVEPSL